MSYVAIRSANVPNAYIRLDGSKPTSTGAGVVSIENKVDTYGIFNLITQSNGSVAIQSVAFPDVYLFLDASRLIPGEPGGLVYGTSGPLSPGNLFHVETDNEGVSTFTLSSRMDCYLRLDVTTNMINAQIGPDPAADFILRDILSEDDVRNAITRYGPVVKFHPDEIYNMCNVYAFMANATLHDSNGTSFQNPSQELLPTSFEGEGRYWFILDDSFKGGDLQTALACVRAYWDPQTDYTDLQFWLMYAYNGPATASITAPGVDGILDLHPLGEHYGDWECCMIRIDNSTKSMIGAWLSQHSGGQMFNAEDLAQFQRVGDQIVVYSSLNGHALYPSKGVNPFERHTYGVGSLSVEVYLCNYTNDGGASLDCSNSEVSGIFSISWLPFAEQPWVDYPYRWGPKDDPIHIDPKFILTLLQKLLPLPELLLKPLANAIASRFKDDRNGPHGPKTKSTWTGGY